MSILLSLSGTISFLKKLTFESGSQDSIVRVWDLRTSPFAAAELKGHQEPIRCIQLGQRSAKDASYVVLTGSEDKTLKVAPIYRSYFSDVSALGLKKACSCLHLERT